MDEQQKLFGLMAIAEEQQKAVQAALEGLKIRRSEMVQAVQQGAEQAVSEAARPVVEQLSGVVEKASGAEKKLSEVAEAVSSRWTWLVGSMALIVTGMMALLTVLMVWWPRHQIDELAKQKTELQDEVEQLQESAKKWAKRAGRAELTECVDKGGKGRLCVRVDQRVGYGENGDYFILKGY